MKGFACLVTAVLTSSALWAGNVTVEKDGLKMEAKATKAEYGQKEPAIFEIVLTNTSKTDYKLYDLAISPYFPCSFSWKIRNVKTQKVYVKGPLMMLPAIAKIPTAQPLAAGDSKTLFLTVPLDNVEEDGKPKAILRPKIGEGPVPGRGNGRQGAKHGGDPLPIGDYELLLTANFYEIPEGQQIQPLGPDVPKEGKEVPFHIGKLDEVKIAFRRIDQDFSPDAALAKKADLVLVGNTYKMAKVADGVVEYTIRTQQFLKGEHDAQDVVYRVKPDPPRANRPGNQIIYLQRDQAGVYWQIWE